jgi:hypothetical protein
MGKSELLRMMTNARNNFTVGLAGVLMLDLGNISDIRGKSSLVLGENYELPFDQVAALLGEDYADKLIALIRVVCVGHVVRATVLEPEIVCGTPMMLAIRPYCAMSHTEEVALKMFRM